MPATTVASLADRLERGAEEVEPLVVGERRALAGRAGDDDPVGAVVDEVAREALERVEVDRAVLAERRDDRRQDAAEHEAIVRGLADARAWPAAGLLEDEPRTGPGVPRPIAKRG